MSGGEAASVPEARERPHYTELPNGRVEHRGEPVMLVLALLVIPAIVAETSENDAVRAAAFALNVVI